MDLLKELTKAYKDYNTKIETDKGCAFFVIVNPYWEENIRISLDNMIFYFSHHHGHCDDSIDYLFDYIDKSSTESLIKSLIGASPLYNRVSNKLF